MPRGERYYIGPGIAKKLPDVIRKVDETLLGGGAVKLPVRLQTLPTPGGGGGSPLSIGSYSTDGLPWEKGQAIDVHLYDLQEETDPLTGDPFYVISPKYDGSGSPETTKVLNLFVTIPPNYDRVRYCAFMPINGVNVVVVAEC